MKEKITMITSGYFPVPPVKGGAVENLVASLVEQNEIFKEIDLEIISVDDTEARRVASEYQETTFQFVKIPNAVRYLDRAIHFLASKILKLDKHLSFRYIIQRIWYLLKVAVLLKKRDAGQIIIQNHATLFWVIKLFGNLKTYAGRYHLHLHNEIGSAFGCEEVISGVNKVIGVSDFINGTFSKRFPDFKDIDFNILPNRVDSKLFLQSVSPEELDQLRIKHDIDKNSKIILFTGRLTKEKGVTQLLDAFQQLEDKFATLLVVGSYYFGSDMSGGYEDELKKSLSHRLKFTGFVPYNEIHKYYQLADIVVLPSIWNDPAPLTVIEALVAAKPLITTLSGGIPEYADNESSVLLPIDGNLVINLKHSIETLLSNPERCQQMSMLLSDKTSDWDLKNYYKNFLEIISS